MTLYREGDIVNVRCRVRYDMRPDDDAQLAGRVMVTPEHSPYSDPWFLPVENVEFVRPHVEVGETVMAAGKEWVVRALDADMAWLHGTNFNGAPWYITAPLDKLERPLALKPYADDETKERIAGIFANALTSPPPAPEASAHLPMIDDAGSGE